MFCDCLRSRYSGDVMETNTRVSQCTEYTGLPNSDSLEISCIACVSKDELVCGDASGALLAFECRSGEVTRRWDGHTRSVAKVRVKCDPDANMTRILTSSRDLTLKLWKLGNDSACQQEFKGHHEHVVSAAAFSPDSKDVICSGSRDNTVALWDVATGSLIHNKKIARNLVTDICWKGTLLAQTSEDKSLRLWDGHNLQLVQTFNTKQQILLSCDVNGTQIATSSGGFNGTGCEVTLWDSRRGSMPVHELKGHTEKVYQCCYVRDSNDSVTYLASVSADRSIKLWNLQTLAEESNCNVGWQMTSLVQMSADSQAMRFGVVSPDSGVHILSMDAHNQWQIYL